MTLFQRICRVLLGLLVLAILPLSLFAASIHGLLGVVAFVAIGAAIWWLYRRVVAAPPAEPQPATANVAFASAASALVVDAGAVTEPAAVAAGGGDPSVVEAAGDPVAVRRGGALVIERRALWAAAAIAATFLLVAGFRFYRLDDLQGEWYGDISTVYEYVTTVREHDYPRDLYNLGVGPLYPLILWPTLAVLGETYLGLKLAAVLVSLAGLVALFLFCRRLRGIWFATIATAVAGTGSWLLIYSRLGDVQAPVLLFTMAPMALAARVAESAERRPWSAGACGLMAGACIYLYGAAFMVPVLTTALLAISLPRSRAQPRQSMPGGTGGAGHAVPKRRDLLIYLAAVAVAALPMAVSYLRAPDAFAQGHFATRFLRGPGWVSTVAGNFVKALLAYVTRGDVSYRGNSPLMAHVDMLALVLAIIGSIYWLKAPSGRKWGAILIGGFLLMHLPSILVSSLEVPSAGRSIAAAPFLYILSASGIWWIAETVQYRWSARRAAVVAVSLLLALAALNAHRYFVRYIGTLPYGNTHIARAITGFVDLLPSNTNVYMVGPPWSPGGMPEPKSIRYNMRAPARFREQPIEDLTCASLATIELPAVLVWSYETELPSPGLSDCAAYIPAQLYTSDRDLPIFHAAAVRRDRAAGDAFTAPLPAIAAATGREDDATRPAEPPPPTVWRTAQLDLAGLSAEMRFMPIDIGGPEYLTDGDPSTVMRGAGDNPFTVELSFAQPARIDSFSFDLGFMPEFNVAVTVVAPDGATTTVTDHQRPEPGTAPRSDLALPNGPLEVASARITIEDIRQLPAEGWHIHIFEMRVGQTAARPAPSRQ